LQYASSGLGGIAHLAGVLLEKMAGISLLHVPYKGSGAGVIDAVSGQVPLIISSVSPVLPFVKNGRLRVLGIGGLKAFEIHAGCADDRGIRRARLREQYVVGHHGARAHA
jgi:tripartite-type tricarboxylate transporter receptor subunit TctC